MALNEAISTAAKSWMALAGVGGAVGVGMTVVAATGGVGTGIGLGIATAGIGFVVMGVAGLIALAVVSNWNRKEEI
jgi:hypothetical protein